MMPSTADLNLQAPLALCTALFVAGLFVAGMSGALGCGGDDEGGGVSGAGSSGAGSSGAGSSGAGSSGGEGRPEEVAGYATLTAFAGQVVANGTAAVEHTVLRAGFVRKGTGQSKCAEERVTSRCVMRTQCEDPDPESFQFVEPAAVLVSGGSLGTTELERVADDVIIAFQKRFDGESRLSVGGSASFAVEGSDNVPSMDVSTPPFVDFIPTSPDSGARTVALRQDEDFALGWNSEEATQEGKVEVAISQAAGLGESNLGRRTLVCTFQLLENSGAIPKEGISMLEETDPGVASVSLSMKVYASQQTSQGEGDNVFRALATAEGSQYSYSASVSASEE